MGAGTVPRMGAPTTTDNEDIWGLCQSGKSAVSLPIKQVPERRSSASVLGHNATSRQFSMQDFPS